MTGKPRLELMINWRVPLAPLKSTPFSLNGTSHEFGMRNQAREILLIGWLPTVIVVHNWCHCRAVWLRSLAAGCSIDQPTLLYIRVCLKLRARPKRVAELGQSANSAVMLNMILKKDIKWCFCSWEITPGGINPLGAQSKFMLSLVLHPERWDPKKGYSNFERNVALSAVKFALQRWALIW